MLKAFQHFNDVLFYLKRLLKHSLILYGLFSVCYDSMAQTEQDSIATVFNDAIENAVSSSDDLSFDYDTEFEYLQDYIRHPLNINKATVSDFENLKLLTSEQISKIIRHRIEHGFYITLYELQAVIDLTTIRKILPFITIDGSLDDFQTRLKDWFKNGKNDLFVRTERRLETAKGYSKPHTEGSYVGNAQKMYTRYRYNFNNKLSYGFTFEKDAGEKWGHLLPDFYSFHFKINDISKRIKTLALGDYAISLGQGLIHHNGFSIGKSSIVLNIEKNYAPIKAYTSSNEINFMRGFAIQYTLAHNTEGVFFASHRQRDGNLILDNSAISSLQTSGLHRTSSELNDKNATFLTTIGGRISHKIKRGTINWNTVINHLDKPLQPRDEPYNLFAFTGKSLFNTSLDYQYTFQNYHFFGETALSDKLGWATINGLLVGLNKKLSLSILQRYFTKEFQSFNAQPFAESSKVNDEIGFYTGFNLKPNKKWTFDAYTDFWKHKWLRFRVDAPSNGHEFFIKTAFKNKMTEGYFHARFKTKQENTSRPDSAKLNTVIDKTKSQLRFNFQYKISPQLTLRNRLEFSIFDDTASKKGFMIYQDAILKYKITSRKGFQYPLSITARLAYFDTPNFDTAIYAYENDLTYNFSVLPYYYQGARWYINSALKFNKYCTAELRVAQSRIFNQNSFGSGLDEISSKHRTDFKAQIHIEF